MDTSARIHTHDTLAQSSQSACLQAGVSLEQPSGQELLLLRLPCVGGGGATRVIRKDASMTWLLLPLLLPPLSTGIAFKGPITMPSAWIVCI